MSVTIQPTQLTGWPCSSSWSLDSTSQRCLHLAAHLGTTEAGPCSAPSETARPLWSLPAPVPRAVDHTRALARGGRCWIPASSDVGGYWGSRHMGPGRLGILLQIEAAAGICGSARFEGEPLGVRRADGAVRARSAGLVEVIGQGKGTTGRGIAGFAPSLR
jgi:hypothetical protein